MDRTARAEVGIAAPCRCQATQPGQGSEMAGPEPAAQMELLAKGAGPGEAGNRQAGGVEADRLGIHRGHLHVVTGADQLGLKGFVIEAWRGSW